MHLPPELHVMIVGHLIPRLWDNWRGGRVQNLANMARISTYWKEIKTTAVAQATKTAVEDKLKNREIQVSGKSYGEELRMAYHTDLLYGVYLEYLEYCGRSDLNVEVGFVTGDLRAFGCSSIDLTKTVRVSRLSSIAVVQKQGIRVSKEEVGDVLWHS